MASTPDVLKSPQNIEQYMYRPQSSTEVNVNQPERWVSALSGGTLVYYGITHFNRAGALLTLLGGSLLYRGITGHSFVYQSMNINTTQHMDGTIFPLPNQKGIRIRRSLTVNRPAADLYNFWHDVENAPRYMMGVQSVMKTGDRTSHWIAQGPGGKPVEWNSEILRDEPNTLIAWHVHGNPTTANAGKVIFTPLPDNRGTVVTTELDYFQFNGALGSAWNKLVGHLPEHEAQENLRRFKELMEAGEIPTTQGQPAGR